MATSYQVKRYEQTVIMADADDFFRNFPSERRELRNHRGRGNGCVTVHEINTLLKPDEDGDFYEHCAHNAGLIINLSSL
jgi:hypothetical protein